MTTAAKFGAQDLNGNPFNYQQLVSPINTGTQNVVVNTTFVNRSGGDARVRLAETSVPLAQQTVASTQGLYPLLATSTASTTLVETQQVLTVGATTTGTNILTTYAWTVTATTAGTNLITVSSTANFTIGEPVVFNTSFGGLVAGQIYYVLTIPSSTTFTVSALFNGSVVSLSTSVVNALVQETTNNLSIGQPILFEGTTFGGVFYNTTYYVLTISSSTTFTVSATPNGSAFALITATGSMYVVPALTTMVPNSPASLNVASTTLSTYANTLQGLTVASTAVTTNLISTATIAVTATTASTTSVNGYITCASTSTLTSGMPVVFSGALGGLTGATVYYVLNVFSTTTFNVSTTLNGAPVTISTASGSITVQQTTTNLQLNQPIMFNGTAFGNVATNTVYYILTIPSTTTFTVSLAPGGTALSLVNASGTMVTSAVPITIPNAVVVSNSTAGSNILTTPTIAVTATAATTNLITCASTSTLAIGSAIIVNSNFGNLIAGNIYYVLTISSSTQFTVSTVPNGAAYSLIAASGSITIQLATTRFQVNQPVIFTGTAFGGVSSGVIYYIQNIVSPTTFQISSVFGGTPLTLTTATGTLTMLPQFITPTLTIGASTTTTNVYTTASISVTGTAGTAPYDITCASTATLSIGMPIVFTTTTNNIVAGTIYYVLTIDSSTTFQISATYGGTPFVLTTGSAANTAYQATTNLSVNQPVIFSGTAFGGVTAGVTYYIQSLISSSGNPIQFTLSTAINGSQLALTTATGTMTTTAGPRPIPTVLSTVSSNILQMQTYTVTATAITTNLITISNTYQLAVGMPVVFNASLGNLVGGVVYYVQSIASATTFTVSATQFGPVFIQVTASGSTTLQQTTFNLSINQPMQFTTYIPGTTFTGVTLGTTYYVRTILSTVTFTLAAAPNNPGATATILTVSGGSQAQFVPITNNIIGTLAYQTAPIAVTATAAGTTYAITCASTTTLSVGQQVVFDSYLSNLVPGVTYYVNAILSGTTFNVSTTLGGTIFVLTAATGTINVYQSTSNLFIGQPIQFYGTAFGGITSGQTYYVQSIPSYNTVMITLLPGSVSNSGLGLSPYQLTAAATGTMTVTVVNPVPPLVVGASAGAAPYTYTTATVAVTAVTTGTNYITCASTATLAPGMPIVFAGAIGSISASTTYYVLSIVSSTQFTVSTSWNGSVQAIASTTTGSTTFSQTTTFLQIGQPIIFYGTVFGGITAGVTYYVLTIPTSTQFTISTAPNYTAQTLSAATGTMYTIVGPYQQMNVASVSSGIFTNATFTATATSAYNGQMMVTVNNTYALYPGAPVVFSSTLGVLVASQVYYVTNIFDETRFMLALAPTSVAALGVNATYQTNYGTVLPLTTTTGSVTLYQSTARFQVGQAVAMYGIIGAVYGTGITNGGVYYITAVSQLTGTFTVSATPGGSSISTGGAGGTNAAMMVIPLETFVSVSNVYQTQTMPIVQVTTSTNVLTVGNLALVTATSIGTNLITCTSTATLSVGLPIVFSAGVGNLSAGVTYYVLTINSSTTFTVAQSWGGQVIILTNSFGGVFVQPSTASLTIGQAITFTNNSFTPSIVPFTTYYVATVPSVTTFTLATSQANAIAGTVISIAATSYGYMTAVASTATLLNNMTAVIAPNPPVTFIGATITVNATNGTALYTPGNTGFLSVNQAVVFTGYVFSGIVAGQTYYVQSILGPNSFTLSSTVGGAAITWNTGTNIMTMQIVQSVGTTLTPYTSYYVNQVPSPGTFTISNSNNPTLTATAATLPSSTTWSAVTYGNGTYAAIANSASSAYSTNNGTTWSAGSGLSGSYTWNDVTFGAGYFVAVSYGGGSVNSVSAYSANGQTWTTGGSMGSVGSFSSVIYGNGVFVSVASGTSTAAVSANNGVTWANYNLPSSTTWSGVAFGNGVFVAVSGGASASTAAAYSTNNGVTWLASTLPASVKWTSIAFGNGIFVAVAATGQTATSTNGVTWTSTNSTVLTGNVATTGWVAIRYGNGYFLAIASGNTAGTSAALSADGVNWTIQTMSASTSWTAIVDGITTWVAVATGVTTAAYMTATVGNTVLTASTGALQVNSNIVTLAPGATTSYFLPNQPVVFVNTSGSTFGGVNAMSTSTGTSYVITATTSSTNLITTASTANLVVGQPIVFVGITAGGVQPFTTYYVASIAGATTFTISLTIGGSAAVLSTTSAQTFYGIPGYYVKAVLNNNQLALTATPGGSLVTIGTGYAASNNIMTLWPLPQYTDFVEYDALIATNGVLTNTGIIVPPNTYLYVSSNTTQVTTTAIGIQELA